MNCQECLAELETGSLRDLQADSAVLQHCATCPDCSQVTTALREREYNAASLLNNLRPASDSIDVAKKAATLSPRRRAGQFAVMLTGAALVVTIWIALQTTFIPMMNRADAIHASGLRTETIPLACLSPEQAGDIINPYVRSHGSTYYLPTSGISAITVRATPPELSMSRQLIKEFEEDPTAACRNRNRNTGTGTGAITPPTRPVLAGEKAGATSKQP